jgi:pyruvate ferredoxin oxidoreductase alpha subunit
MVPPEYFMEVRCLAHRKQEDSLEIIECAGRAFEKKFGRNSGGLLRGYSLPDADTIIVAMGSVAGTIKDAVDELNQEGGKFGELSIVCYRPFPEEALRSSLKNAKKVIVVEKSLAVGIGGILSREIELAMKGCNVEVVSVIAGLGGRNITKLMLKECFSKKNHEKITFLGLRNDIVEDQYKQISSCGC